MGSNWSTALRTAVVSGSLGSVASLVALALGGRVESGRPLAPVNAPSHWLWGDRALRRDGASLRYTLVGVGVHHASSIFWGVVHARLFGNAPRRAAAGLRDALLIGALAAWVDLRLVPHRLTPGFQRRLSPPGLLVVYLSFALGLAAGHHLVARLQRRALGARPHAEVKR